MRVVLFEQLLTELQITEEDREEYVASSISTHLVDYLEAHYNDFPMLITILALAEENVMVFAPYMRENCKALGINVDKGYYHVHGDSSDEENEGRDDFHQNDLWLILAQIMGDYDRDALLAQCDTYMDKWIGFWDQDFTTKLVKSSQLTEELQEVAA